MSIIAEQVVRELQRKFRGECFRFRSECAHTIFCTSLYVQWSNFSGWLVNAAYEFFVYYEEINHFFTATNALMPNNVFRRFYYEHGLNCIRLWNSQKEKRYQRTCSNWSILFFIFSKKKSQNWPSLFSTSVCFIVIMMRRKFKTMEKTFFSVEKAISLKKWTLW